MEETLGGSWSVIWWYCVVTKRFGDGPKGLVDSLRSVGRVG